MQKACLRQPMPGFPGRSLRPVIEMNGIAQRCFDLPLHKGKMRTAQHQTVDVQLPIGGKELLQVRRHGLSLLLSRLHQPYNAGSRQTMNFAMVLMETDQILQPVSRQCGLRRHHQHPGTGKSRRIHCRLHRRLHPHNNGMGIFLPKIIRCRRGGRIAGNHHGLHLLPKKEMNICLAKPADALLVLLPIGGMQIVTVKDEVLRRKLPPQGPQHTDTPCTGIKYADRRMLNIHSSSS